METRIAAIDIAHSTKISKPTIDNVEIILTTEPEPEHQPAILIIISYSNPKGTYTLAEFAYGTISVNYNIQTNKMNQKGNIPELIEDDYIFYGYSQYLAELFGEQVLIAIEQLIQQRLEKYFSNF